MKIINGMAVQPNTDVRIDCPFCFHPNTFTLKNIDGKIMWNCFRASCNAKGKISRDMSPEELKKFLNSQELSLQNKMKSENKIKKPLEALTKPHKHVKIPYTLGD